MIDANRPARLRAALLGALSFAALATPGALVLASGTAQAQTAGQAGDPAETRLRKIEAELRAVQRKVFPDGAGRTFGAEITPPAVTGATPPSAPTATPVTDLLTRMDALEAQVRTLTATTEENQNRLAKLESRVSALEPQPGQVPVDSTGAPVAATPTPVPTPTPAAVRPAPAPAPAAKPAPTPAAVPAPKPAAIAAPTGPSAERVAAVAAIERPVSDDKAEDEYSYGYRLWEAKFFPEAQQQLQHFVQTYPKHKRISYARNLLGRAYLDDNKPGTAAQWFVQNYLGDKQGDRAADSLLYLGVAMTRLKETKRACTAFSEFKTTYPAETTGRLKAQYEAASKAVTCN